MNYETLMNQLIPESSISKILTSNTKFPKEKNIFTHKRRLKMINKQTFIYSTQDSSVQFHFNFCKSKGRLLKQSLDASSEWLTEQLKRIKFVLWKESFNFRSKSLGIEAQKDQEIEEEGDSSLLKEWQYEEMLAQDYPLYRSSPPLMLEKLKKVFIVKNRELFESIKKDSLFLFSFKILTEDSNIEKVIVNGLIFSFYLCLQNCLDQKISSRLFYIESLNLVPDYRGKGRPLS